jgi:DNA-binding XRE family transcriptional regulator
MTAMIDVQCPKCARRFGWGGKMVDHPGCPRCGYRPPQEALERSDRDAEAFGQRLRTAPALAEAETLRLQRVDSGLTLRQAARLLRVTPTHLSDIESGRLRPSAELAEHMAKVYGLDVAAGLGGGA